MGEKLTNWEERLAMYIETIRDVPFQWHVNDCVTLAAGAVEAVAGFDPMAHHRDSYKDERSGKLLIAREGGLAALVMACGCFTAVDPAFASRGDVVLVIDEQGEDSLRVCVGEDFVGPGPEGLSFSDNCKKIKAFKLCPQ